jgi:hypothetical protein
MPSYDLFQPNIEVELNPTVLEVELQESILTVINDGGFSSKVFTISNDDLIGSSLVVKHDFNTSNIDVTVRDSNGVIYLDWTTLDDNNIIIDFSNMVPLTQIYNILIEI